MSEKSLSPPGMTAGATPYASSTDAAHAARFDPPRYFTPVSVPGYALGRSVAAARRLDRRRKAQDDPNACASQTGTDAASGSTSDRSTQGPAMRDGNSEDASTLDP